MVAWTINLICIPLKTYKYNPYDDANGKISNCDRFAESAHSSQSRFVWVCSLGHVSLINLAQKTLAISDQKHMVTTYEPELRCLVRRDVLTHLPAVRSHMILENVCVRSRDRTPLSMLTSRAFSDYVYCSWRVSGGTSWE